MRRLEDEEGNEGTELSGCENRNADVLGLPGGAFKTILSVRGVETHSGGEVGEGVTIGWVITSP